MATKIKVKIRNRSIEFDAGTSKADIARTLFSDNAANYTTNEVSKAVPMAYSQAMTIRNKMLTGRVEVAQFGKPSTGRVELKPTEVLRRAKGAQAAVDKIALRRSSGFTVPKEDLEAIAKRDIPTARQLAKNAKQKKTGVTARVGKLRTPGHSSDIDVGECANCGHDLVVRSTPVGYMLVHVNTTAEEYLATTQFCTAVPKLLL